MHKLLAAWMLGWCAMGAQAQTALEDRSGESTLACLVRPTAPGYPAQALEQRTGGMYRLQLTFTDAQRAPEVKVLFGSGSQALREEAERYGKQFKLPCLAAGRTVSLLQEVSFRAVSDGDVQAPQPLNLPVAANQRFAACVRTPAEGPWIGEATQLQAFKRQLKNGNLIVQMTFTAPDQPPQAKILYDTLNARHRSDLMDYVAKYRVPCLTQGERFEIQQTFHVGFEDNPRFAFKDVGLVKFLGLVRNVEARPVHFNLDTMGCPFRLQFTLGRPAVANRVVESGPANLNRRSFIGWIEELELGLTREQFENLLGAELFIDVPCGTIKLG